MAITGYRLRINGGSLVNSIVDVGNVLTYDKTGLDSNTEYAFEVASYNDRGQQSVWSPVVGATTDDNTGAVTFLGDAVTFLGDAVTFTGS